MKGNFRTLLKRYCLQSSVLGLKYFYLFPDWVTRCFWATTLAVLFCLACQMALLLYERFEHMPTRITIENQYEPMNHLPYPAITICSPNQITVSALNHLKKTIVNGDYISRLDDLVHYTLGFYQIYDSKKEELDILQKLIDDNRYTISEVLTLLPQQCDEFLRLCVFQTVMYERCRGLFHPILTAHGLCCTFNSIYYLKDGQRNDEWVEHKVHRIRGAGLPAALTVVADYQPADALDGTVGDAGALRVLFTDYTEFPADDTSALVQTNSESFHIMHATYTYCSDEVLQLPVYTRKCFMSKEKKLRSFREYHSVECGLACRASAVEHACGCRPAHLPRLPLAHACNFTALPCMAGVHANMDYWLSGEECDCPRDCESRHYSAEMSYGNLEALPYATSSLYTVYPLNKSSAVMHFFPTSHYVKKKQETVMSLISLASNLGGVFGLCLGCSAVSVIEFVFYMYSVARNRCRQRRRHRRA